MNSSIIKIVDIVELMLKRIKNKTTKTTTKINSNDKKKIEIVTK